MPRVAEAEVEPDMCLQEGGERVNNCQIHEVIVRKRPHQHLYCLTSSATLLIVQVEEQLAQPVECLAMETLPCCSKEVSFAKVQREPLNGDAGFDYQQIQL